MTTAPRPRLVAELGALILLVLVGSATPAGADAPRPGDFRSAVTSSTPALPKGVVVRVVGGDSFLEVQVARGHRVVVPDYGTDGDADATPYLRFGANGRVERNELAVATAANESRYGAASSEPDQDAAPRWTTVATDGRYAWHDHRIHWMAPTRPRAVDGRGKVDLGGPNGSWQVALVVDGRATVVSGDLFVEPRPSPLPWFALGAIVGAVVVLTAVRLGMRPSATAVALVSGVGSLAAWATWRAAPEGSGVSPMPLLVVGMSLVAAILAATAIGPPRVRLAAVGAAAAGLLGWGVLRWTVLARAELPTTLPFWFDRMSTALALGAGCGLAVVLVWQPKVVLGAPTSTFSPRRAVKSA